MPVSTAALSLAPPSIAKCAAAEASKASRRWCTANGANGARWAAGFAHTVAVGEKIGNEMQWTGEDLSGDGWMGIQLYTTLRGCEAVRAHIGHNTQRVDLWGPADAWRSWNSWLEWVFCQKNRSLFLFLACEGMKILVMFNMPSLTPDNSVKSTKIQQRNRHGSSWVSTPHLSLP